MDRWQNTLEKSFLQYYLRELSVLEDDCALFASAYPQVATNLGLEGGGSADPHVRQLIESVAFIAARIKRQIDSVPGQLALSLVNSVAPHLTAPVPCMSVARFTPRSDQSSENAVAPKGLRLVASTKSEEVIFTVCSNSVTLRPLILEDVKPSDPAMRIIPELPSDNEAFVLKITQPNRKIAQGDPGDLTFFISGAINRALQAIDSIVFGVESLFMVALDGSWTVPLKKDSIEIQGFDSNDRMMPPHLGSFSAGDIAAEFLNFPRRFCFFRVVGLKCPKPTSGFFLVFSVKRSWSLALEMVRGHVLLNCFPIINLFRPAPVAVRLNGDMDEYFLPRGDSGASTRWDVFAIQRVELMGPSERYEILEAPAMDAASLGDDAKIYWQSVRRQRIAQNLGHAGLSLRFIGLELARSQGLKADLALIEFDASNCDAAEDLEARHPLYFQGWECPYAAHIEVAPSPYVSAVAPTDQTLVQILRVLQSREGRLKHLGIFLRRYLEVHNRSISAHAVSSIAAIENVTQETVLIPWPDAPPGAMPGLGYRYTISYSKKHELIGSSYILSKTISRILKQMSALPFPVEIYSEDGRGGTFHVR